MNTNKIIKFAICSSHLTLTSVVFELFICWRFNKTMFNLTLTSVVFESINAIAIPNDNDDLTLTSVVFEYAWWKSKRCLPYI